MANHSKIFCNQEQATSEVYMTISPGKPPLAVPPGKHSTEARVWSKILAPPLHAREAALPYARLRDIGLCYPSLGEHGSGGKVSCAESERSRRAGKDRSQACIRLRGPSGGYAFSNVNRSVPRSDNRAWKRSSGRFVFEQPGAGRAAEEALISPVTQTLGRRARRR